MAPSLCHALKLFGGMVMGRRETGPNGYQSKLIKKLKELYPNAIILRNDPTYLQGVPDITILEGKRWAALETKGYANAKHRPNQDYMVEKMNDMSFSRFIYPENEEEVLHDLENTLHKKRARISRSE